MEYKQTMGKRISDLRKSKGMTQEQLAQQVGVTAQAVSKWENDLSCPDISILPQLAEALGVTTDELLGRTPLQEVKSETSETKSKAHVSVKLRMSNVEKLAFALLLMGIGVIFLLNAFHVIALGEGITFWIIACEVMEVVTDKMLFAQTFLKDLHGRGIAFLHADHGDR